ncbi:bacteriocin maturation protein [Paenibacillus sp. WQ 127069]|uniref:Bacteriocin maturation protein n=1 Tax=Paenibacillus baimaensis TaxID=2982185 RepID=A0ABT2U9C9_9BACL|nr:bacteriocin maturation protein [Paenibacillus sp. WQ 127069]MCU6790791.1 bacteriocin maturation protein [Paenibacillus sp. WQ 127069]
MKNSESFVPLKPYLHTKVLAIGCGPFLVSLADALLESGWLRFHILITESVPTDREQLKELVEHARLTDPMAVIEELCLDSSGRTEWHETVAPFHSILYVSQETHIEELRNLNAVCKVQQKLLLPAFCIQQVGLVGPLVHPDMEGCWESAWRRLHQAVLGSTHLSSDFSSTAGTMLANVMVFEWLKALSGATEFSTQQAFFLLNLNTLEGDWHSFVPHPLVTGLLTAPDRTSYVKEFEIPDVLTKEEREPYGWFPYFSRLTSSAAGIFHTWEEGDLGQLPLAQCRVQVADPLSEGPAKLLPDVIRSGLTHEEARRDVGLAGIEAYVKQLSTLLTPELPPYPYAHENGAAIQPFVGIGAGETVAEGVCRGLLICLTDTLTKSLINRKPLIRQVLPGNVEDERCKYYLQALTLIQGAPTIGLGMESYGFPVVWVGINGLWHGHVGLNTTLALRSVLQQALLFATSTQLILPPSGLVAASVILETKEPSHLIIPSTQERTSSEILAAALQILKRDSKRLHVMDMANEPFLKEGLVGVWGVLVREEDSR